MVSIRHSRVFIFHQVIVQRDRRRAEKGIFALVQGS